MSNLNKINTIREAFPVIQNKAYMNTGSVGPISRPMMTALNAAHQNEAEQGRGVISTYMAFKEEILPPVRQLLGELVGATPDTIALTHHTTAGMNIVTHGIDWQAGDEVVTTNLEHPGGYIPLYVVKQRFGVRLHVVDIAWQDSAEMILHKLKSAITPRTRLLMISHVAWNIGTRLALTEIVEMAHKHNVLVLVDAAQSAGAIPLDLPATGVDFYAMPGQKWLCGMEGTGALYVRPDRLSLISPTFVGYSSIHDGVYDRTGNWMPHMSARRFEIGSVNRPAFFGWLAHLRWMKEEVGWAWAYDRIDQLKQYTEKALAGVRGLDLISPLGTHAGLCTFTLDGYAHDRVVLALEAQNIVIRAIAYPDALRTATGFYNHEADIDRLVAALRAITQEDPESLPPSMK